MSKNTPVAKFTLNCSDIESIEVRQTFLELSNEARFDDVIISIPKDREADGFKAGNYKLTDIFKVLACDVEPSEDSDDQDILINDSDTSNQELLFECYELLHMIAQTEYFADTTIEIGTIGINTILDQGLFHFPTMIQNLAYMVEDTYNELYDDQPFSDTSFDDE